MDDPSITGLNVQCQVWLETFKVDVVRFVIHRMSRKIINKETDVPILLAHLDIKILEPPVVGTVLV